jgi:hypothetical protein
VEISSQTMSMVVSFAAQAFGNEFSKTGLLNHLECFAIPRSKPLATEYVAPETHPFFWSNNYWKECTALYLTMATTWVVSTCANALYHSVQGISNIR